MEFASVVLFAASLVVSICELWCKHSCCCMQQQQQQQQLPGVSSMPLRPSGKRKSGRLGLAAERDIDVELARPLASISIITSAGGSGGGVADYAPSPLSPRCRREG